MFNKVLFSVLSLTFIGNVFAAEVTLNCTLKSVLNSSNPEKTLVVVMNEEDATKTTVNNVQAQAAVNSQIAQSIGMAQIVKVNNQQVAISLNYQNLYIKDVAQYSCVE